MSETKRDLECTGCRAYITTFLPGTGWVCKFCGPREADQMRTPTTMNSRELTVRSLAFRAVLHVKLPEVDTMGNRTPDEEHVLQVYDGATAREHYDFLRHLLDIHQLKLGQEFDGGWWIARKRTTDPSFSNPYEPTKIQIRGTDHVITI